MAMRKKQRVLAIIMTAVMIFAMVGATVFSYFFGAYQYAEEQPATGSQNTENTQPAPQDGYPELKQLVAELNQQLEAEPDNIDLWTDLGNAYYDLAVAALEANPEEVADDLHQAVDVYQYVLQSRQDVNVMLDLATAAYYLGDDALAEASFQDALKEQPNNYYALYNYGMFLHDAKQDLTGAIEQWEKALALNPQDEQLKALIDGTKIELEALQAGQTP